MNELIQTSYTVGQGDKERVQRRFFRNLTDAIRGLNADKERMKVGPKLSYHTAARQDYPFTYGEVDFRKIKVERHGRD